MMLGGGGFPLVGISIEKAGLLLKTAAIANNYKN